MLIMTETLLYRLLRKPDHWNQDCISININLYTNIAQLSLFSYNVENHIVNRNTGKITRLMLIIIITNVILQKLELSKDCTKE